ncbi:MAG: methylmalonyl Co-A mutase-associated GTPase MeaB [Roseivirga sp.]|nr:methylmalonyl Co-A mutase-associated GTPase MeaB [Roseivirga sp.]
MARQRLTTSAYIEGVLAGDRLVLSRAITLIESARPDDTRQAEEVLQAVLDRAGKSIRIGVTGVPGVGKSTFLEAFGKYVTDEGHKIAVLTIDPSSQRTRGSILGDKTRMEELSRNPNAFIRPSASGTALGGVNNRTREVMLLCEAAGYEVIFIETVGVGQSETLVHGMVDFFLLLMLAGAGDELQGIKKGIMEMADAVVINKADGDNIKAAKRASAEYKNALHLFPVGDSGWIPEVKTCSSLMNMGLDNIWEMVKRHQRQLSANGFFEHNRKQQNIQWMKERIGAMLEDQFYQHTAVRSELPELIEKVASGNLPALNAAHHLLNQFLGDKQG